MTTEPWENTKREKEANLNEYRLALGLTIDELCERTRIHKSTYVEFNSGVRSPIYLRTGKLKPDAEALVDFFRCGVEDLFPRYFCKFRSASDSLLNSQIAAMSGANEGSVPSAEHLYELNEFLDWLDDNLDNLNIRGTSKNNNDRHRLAFSMLALGYTLAETGKVLKVTRERVRQMVRKTDNILNTRLFKSEYFENDNLIYL